MKRWIDSHEYWVLVFLVLGLAVSFWLVLPR